MSVDIPLLFGWHITMLSGSLLLLGAGVVVAIVLTKLVAKTL